MQLRRLTAAPLTHEAATSTAPSDGREVQLGVHATKRSNSPRRQQAGEMLTPWKVRARALLFQDTYASPPPPTGNECESTPSSRGISPASQTGAGEDPTTPHHPGPAAAEDAFAQEQSHGFYDVQTANRKSKRGGQRTGPLPQGACRNHSRILDVNKAHSSSIQVCSQHLWLVSCDRARRLSVILGFWAPNDQGLRAATGHPLLLGEHTED